MVFDVCDIEKDDKGLTLAEVQEKNCMDYLTSGFGITNDNIIKEFEAVDQNGDGVASKQETSLAFENLSRNLLRIIDPNEPSDDACFDKCETWKTLPKKLLKIDIEDENIRVKIYRPMCLSFSRTDYVVEEWKFFLGFLVVNLFRKLKGAIAVWIFNWKRDDNLASSTSEQSIQQSGSV